MNISLRVSSAALPRCEFIDHLEDFSNHGGVDCTVLNYHFSRCEQRSQMARRTAAATWTQPVLREVMFVMLVLLAFLISVIVGYSRNLKLLFLNQTHTLEKVSAGDLQAYVPVISNDEFGRIAFHTNTMIDGLREKEKIQSVFGKMVSPRIAERLLGSDHNALGGEKLNVTVLMSDVRREFTALSESITPEELVSIMNKYFTAMVEIIHHHAPVKSISLSATVFWPSSASTTNNKGHKCSCTAATEMAAAAKLSAELGQTIKVGLGIHYGEVIAGRIGSPDGQKNHFHW